MQLHVSLSWTFCVRPGLPKEGKMVTVSWPQIIMETADCELTSGCKGRWIPRIGSACHESGTFFAGVGLLFFSVLFFKKDINCELTGRLSRKCVEKELQPSRFSVIYKYLYKTRPSYLKIPLVLCSQFKMAMLTG